MATTFAKHGTLVADAVATATLTRDFQTVSVVNVDGAAAIYFTVDGASPTVAGDDTYVLPAAICALEIPAPSSGSTTVVKLISSGTPKYAVQGML